MQTRYVTRPCGRSAGNIRGDVRPLTQFTDGWHEVTSLDVFTANVTDPTRTPAKALLCPVLTGIPEGVAVHFEDVEAYFTPAES